MDYFDVVRAKRDLVQTTAQGVETVKAGTEGTIVMVFDERVGDKPQLGKPMDYIVDFVDTNDEYYNTIAVMTVNENDLELVTPYKPKPQYEWIEDPS